MVIISDNFVAIAHYLLYDTPCHATQRKKKSIEFVPFSLVMILDFDFAKFPNTHTISLKCLSQSVQCKYRA